MSKAVNRGRTKVTDKPDVVSLLVSCLRDGMTVTQACMQSGVSREAYYKRMREDLLFADKMNYAQQSVTIAAKQAVIKAIRDGDVKVSQWWLDKFRFAEQPVEQPPEEAHEPVSSVDEAIERLQAYKKLMDEHQQKYANNL